MDNLRWHFEYMGLGSAGIRGEQKMTAQPLQERQVNCLPRLVLLPEAFPGYYAVNIRPVDPGLPIYESVVAQRGFDPQFA
jgi:hypothetical protein